MELVCTLCHRSQTSQWYSGPMCGSCYRREYRKKHREQDRLYKRCRYSSRPDVRMKTNEYKKRWYQLHKSEVIRKKAEYQAQQLKTNLAFKLRRSLRGRLNSAIKTNQKSGSAVKDLGCSIPELKVYLESKFQPGMTWDNWTTDGWHIDHIKPLDSFDLSNPEQLKQACHYSNLQPLWAKDNLSKGNKDEY